MACFVLGCKSHSSRKENEREYISFHRFPLDEEVKKKWCQVIPQRKHWTKHSRVCSKHFTQECFINISGKWRRLKPDAVPSLLIPTVTEEQVESLTTESTTNIFKSNTTIGQDNAVKIPTVPAMSVDELQATTNTRHVLTNMRIGQVQEQTIMKIPTISAMEIDESQPPVSTTHILTSDTRLGESKFVAPMDVEIEIPTTSSTCCPELRTRISHLEQDLEKVKKVSKRRLLKINALRQKKRRLQKKNVTLNDRLTDLLEQENIEKDKLLMLDSVKNNKIIEKYLLKQHGDTTRAYDLELKKFAVTLHFLSPRAYSFVREELKNILPHPKTIGKWYQGLGCDPGFTSEAFEAIKLRVKANQGKPIYCALSFDEMAIRKLVEWDGRNYFGYVNVGCDLDTDVVPLAREALTYMLTSVNDSWKIPIGYFLIDSITAQQKATLLEQCLSLLKDCGVIVISVTFDGAATNKAMCTYLGCDMSSLCFYFNNDGRDICIWPDPCHNIKLVRNTFADKKTIIDNQGRTINWHYIELLNEIQNEEGLHLGTKLKNEHVNFVKQKMKVRLATQLLSASVADALRYCHQSGIPDFSDSEGTFEFIRMFNNIFDIMNSRTMRANGWKKALTTFNIQETEIFFETAIQYIESLKFSDGTIVCKSNRSTGFIGFIICMKSLIHLYKNLIEEENSVMKYLCTYKLNQDHIELFFGAIRAQCGYNNNPSARMYRAAYKKLLVHAQLKNIARGNCLPLEEIKVLNYAPDKFSKMINATSNNGRLIENLMSCDNVLEDFDHDYILTPSSLSEYASHVVQYIAGFVVRKLKKILICEKCVQSLDMKKSESFSLIKIKDRGGLIMPSHSVTKVCNVTEKILREFQLQVGSKCVGQPKYMLMMISKVSQRLLCTQIFEDLIEHSFENNVTEDHRFLLIKSIIQFYLNIRIFHITKQLSVSKDKIRSFLNKTVIFKGQ